MIAPAIPHTPPMDMPSQDAIRGLAEVFKSLAEKARLHILFLLNRHGELTVSDLGDHIGQSQPAVSHHLNQLKRAGLIDYRRDGKFNYYHLTPGGLSGLVQELFPEPIAEKKLKFGGLEVAFPQM